MSDTPKRKRTPQTYQVVAVHNSDVEMQDLMDIVEQTIEAGGVVLTSLPMPVGAKEGNRTSMLNKVKASVKKSSEETPSVYADKAVTVVSYPEPQVFVSEQTAQRDKERIQELEQKLKELQEKELAGATSSQ